MAETNDLLERTRQFSLRVIAMVRAMPTDMVSQTLGKQILRSGTSVGANYRASQRARSTAEFRAKLGIVEEESDETTYWLEQIRDAGIIPVKRLESLIAESQAITAMIVAAIRTSKQRRPR